MWWTLCVLLCVYALSFCDRTILSILSEQIKADLGLTDAELGFLYGTAFSVFYAIFGLSFARVADLANRKNTITAGLLLWSLLTTLTGTAESFLVLAFYRIGVGVGEAAASPSAYSMLADSFPLSKRGTALSTYSAGVYVGAGLGTVVGGWCVSAWGSDVDDSSSSFPPLTSRLYPSFPPPPPPSSSSFPSISPSTLLASFSSHITALTSSTANLLPASSPRFPNYIESFLSSFFSISEKGSEASQVEIGGTGNAPLGLQAWQMAFALVGLPGLLLAVCVVRLKEPIRGAVDAAEETEQQADPAPSINSASHFSSARTLSSASASASALSSSPFSICGVLSTELFSSLPLFQFYTLYKFRASRRAFLFSLFCLFFTLGICVLLTFLLGDIEQWIALGTCTYAALCWVQVLSYRDKVAYRTLFHSRAYILLSIAAGLNAFNGYGFSFWLSPYFLRAFDVSEQELGSILGPMTVVLGLGGTVLGGVVGDRMERRFGRHSHLLADIGSSALTLIGWYCFLFIDDFALTLPLVGLNSLLAWSTGLGPTILFKLLIPEVRGAGTGLYLLATTVLGLALGPYVIGKLSDGFADLGMSSAASLRTSLLLSNSLVALKIALQTAVLVSGLYGRDIDEKHRRAEGGLESEQEALLSSA